LTQSAVAEIAGVTQASVSRWLKGTIPDEPYAVVLADKLAIPFEWLMFGEGDGPHQSESHSFKEAISSLKRNAAASPFKEMASSYRKALKDRRGKMGDAEIEELQNQIEMLHRFEKGSSGLIDFLTAFPPQNRQQDFTFRKHVLPYLMMHLQALGKMLEEARRRKRSALAGALGEKLLKGNTDLSGESRLIKPALEADKPRGEIMFLANSRDLASKSASTIDYRRKFCDVVGVSYNTSDEKLEEIAAQLEKLPLEKRFKVNKKRHKLRGNGKKGHPS
jgi:transcriptional regulator with XRE-family HTH domain